VLSKAPIGLWPQQPFLLSGDRRRTEDTAEEERGGKRSRRSVKGGWSTKGEESLEV
jgi:hypothetical protein